MIVFRSRSLNVHSLIIIFSFIVWQGPNSNRKTRDIVLFFKTVIPTLGWVVNSLSLMNSHDHLFWRIIVWRYLNWNCEKREGTVPRDFADALCTECLLFLLFLERNITPVFTDNTAVIILWEKFEEMQSCSQGDDRGPAVVASGQPWIVGWLSWSRPCLHF